MSSPRTRITTLNLGSQSIELAEFRVQPKGGLILCGYRSRELLLDPAKEGTRHTQIAQRETLGAKVRNPRFVAPPISRAIGA